ncbi:MAG: sulfur carrier protein ThiS [Tannerella sp.]|jgi:sulfur carrier protein|nr:sulfur carrier protein ThiS [Tannerella sp.]
MSQIKVNEEALEVQLPLSLSELIALREIFQPEMVSVQINGEFIEREQFDETVIQAGDEVDFLYFMGGGGR